MAGKKIKSFVIQMLIDYIVHLCLVIAAVTFCIVLTKVFGASDELAAISATILIFAFYLSYFSKWRRRRPRKDCLEEVFDRVPDNLRNRGFTVKESGEKEWTISRVEHNE